MKKILIALNDAILMSVYKSWVFRSQKKDVLLFAKDGKEAFDLIQSEAIDLLIADLSLPEMDGLELVASIAWQRPNLKIALFISATALSLNMQDKLKHLRSLYFINKPSSLREFIHLVSVIEVTDFQALTVADIIIADFLELIECQKKTCLLAIEHQGFGQRGLMYFEHGVLYDAVYGDSKAEVAVVEMLSWEVVKFAFKTLANKQFRRQIHTSLSVLIKDRVSMKAKLSAEKSSLALQQEKLESQPADANIELPLSTSSLSPLEVAHQAKVETPAIAFTTKISALNFAPTLLPLQDMEDYLASAVFTIDGESVTEHQAHNMAYRLEILNLAAIDLIKIAVQTMFSAGLGKFTVVQILSEQGIFAASWAVENQLIAAVLLSSKAQSSGLAKIQLMKTCMLIRAQLGDASVE